MPRLIQECVQNSGWQEVEVPSASNEVVFYLVTLPPWDRSEEEAVCECPGYEFRGRCRHQREALALICNWSELDSIPQTADEQRRQICPECKGPTQVVILNG
jgi:hypothetical protein